MASRVEEAVALIVTERENGSVEPIDTETENPTLNPYLLILSYSEDGLSLMQLTTSSTVALMLTESAFVLTATDYLEGSSIDVAVGFKTQSVYARYQWNQYTYTDVETEQEVTAYDNWVVVQAVSTTIPEEVVASKGSAVSIVDLIELLLQLPMLAL